MDTTPLEYRAGRMRDYVLPVLAAAAVFLLPFSWILGIMVVVGHAHFFMAYLYQVKGGKINAQYLGTAVLLLILGITCVTIGVPLVPLLVVAGIVFSAHFALDEFTLHGEALSRQSILTIVGFTLLYSSLILLFAFPSLVLIPLIAGAVLVIAIVFRLIFNDGAPTSTELYLWLVGTILFIFAVGMHMADKILAIIVLLHFSNWYIGYGDRLRSLPIRAGVYWVEMTVTLLVSGTLFVLYSVFHMEALTVLFGLTYFYLWTAAHIVLSFLTATYRLR